MVRSKNGCDDVTDCFFAQKKTSHNNTNTLEYNTMSDDNTTDLLISLGIPPNHLSVGTSNLNSLNNTLQQLLTTKKLPNNGLSSQHTEQILLWLSSLDTNNHMKKCGVGEREGRVYSELVKRRHWGMSHGIGRSGDIVEPQPKAAGSSVMYKLATQLALDAVRRGAGLKAIVNDATGKVPGPASGGILLPLCTGMSMTVTLQALKTDTTASSGNISNACSYNKSKQKVLWSRIDQKSCFKAIIAAGLTPVVIPTKIIGNEVVTDLVALQHEMERNENDILAIVTTTSAFAPRVPDDVDMVAKLCKTHGICHVINNAYGLQCSQTCKLINRACTVGRVDAIVMSTDKNFLVPVGGALVLSPDTNVIQAIGKIYPGRANSSPIMDLFITLLSMGLSGYQQLLADRRRLAIKFKNKFQEVAIKYGERALECPRNSISFGITLDNLGKLDKLAEESPAEYAKRTGLEISYFGSMLFTRCVSGTRVVPKGQVKSIGGYEFVGFGSSTENYENAYLTAACAIGIIDDEVDEFFLRLDKAFKDAYAKRARKAKKTEAAANSK